MKRILALTIIICILFSSCAVEPHYWFDNKGDRRSRIRDSRDYHNQWMQNGHYKIKDYPFGH